MSYAKRDLLLHFDEASGQYCFYAVDSADAARLREAAGGKLAADPAFFGAAGSAEAEQAIGRMVLTLLDRAYVAAPLAGAPATASSIPAAAPAADGSAEYAQFLSLQSEAMKTYSAELLAQAEAKLEAAARLGYADAKQAVQDWPAIKGVTQKLIARGPQPG